ncbi:peroxiredoxin family protein [Thiorhodovibrio winogradskyi]|nr:TlpA disulfide reductase family protein [Thiorhodovibrio winogradskyi]
MSALLVMIPLTALARGDLLDPMPEAPLAPAFELQTPDGARVALADLRGEIVLVNFWATWCPPCRAEMPAMERAWQELRDKGVRFLAINVDEDGGTVADFAKSLGVSFPLLLDPGGKVTQAWPLRGLPTTFVVDADGRLRLIALGEREWDEQPIMRQILSLAAGFTDDTERHEAGPTDAGPTDAGPTEVGPNKPGPGDALPDPESEPEPDIDSGRPGDPMPGVGPVEDAVRDSHGLADR